MKIDLNAQMEQVEKTYNVGGNTGFYKVQEGENRIRLMSEMIPHLTYYKGNKNFKMLCYILDRRDGHVKPYTMPYSIAKNIANLQNDPEYKFDEIPMPYDLKIVAKGAGTKEVEYSVIAGRSNTALKKEELEELGKKTPIQELHEKLKGESEKNTNRASQTGDQGEIPPMPEDENNEIKVEDIPF